ncbi:hypothetical protein SLEP1_g60298, partial [Rubroshorea leprosula]
FPFPFPFPFSFPSEPSRPGFLRTHPGTGFLGLGSKEPGAGFEGTQALGSLESTPGFFEPAGFHGTRPWVPSNPGMGSTKPSTPGFFELAGFHGTRPWVPSNPGMGSMEPKRGFEEPSTPGFFEPAGFHGTRPWVPSNPGMGSMEPKRGFEEPSTPRKQGKEEEGKKKERCWVRFNPGAGFVCSRKKMMANS